MSKYSNFIPSRGFASVGLVRPMDKGNVGAIMRAAYCFNVHMVAIQGDRINLKGVKHKANVCKSWRHIPIVMGESLQYFVPVETISVAVDLVEGAEPLPTYKHPERAFYVFGPEDGTLEKPSLDWCDHRIMIPTRRSMNLASTVYVVLYDRMMKQYTAKQE